MGKDTSIAWTNATLNFGWGCRKVDSACQNCYMFRLSKGWGIDPTKVRLFDIAKREKELNSWPPEKRLIFVNDMTDTFGEFNPFELIAQWHRFFERHPEREFQLLTKRIGRAMVFYRDHWGTPPRNVWIGCSIGEKRRLWRLNQLRQIDAKVRFVSFEPLIEDLREFDLRAVHWAIVGGESDRSNPRPMKPEWAESIRRICERDEVAFFFKQMGGMGGDSVGGDYLHGTRYRQMPMQGVGLKGMKEMTRQSVKKAVPEDWGKTQPFWCLACGEGYPSVERVRVHYASEGHGNESMSVGSRGLDKKQQIEGFRLRNK